jgi:signal transduction histidine kinase
MGAQVWGSEPIFLVLLGVLALLNTRDFSRRSSAECLFWLILQILAVAVTSVVGSCGPLFIFNLLITAKAVLLLGVRNAISVVLLNVAALFLLVTVCNGVFQHQSMDVVSIVGELGLQLVLFAIVNIIIVFLSRAIVHEAEMRRRVEELAHQNDALTAELERNRIARDLHDSLGHTLVSLGLQLEIIQEFRTIDEARVNKSLSTAKELLNNLIMELRRAVHVIHDPAFKLDRSLQDLVQQIHLNDKLSVDLKIDANGLPNRIGRELYCITKECLTNVQKHACASTVTVNLEKKPTCVELSIVDNGQGFCPTSTEGGSGLNNIEQRVQILDGKLSLSSSPDSGTKILVRIPCE